jgi:hypothetical protein
VDLDVLNRTGNDATSVLLGLCTSLRLGVDDNTVIAGGAISDSRTIRNRNTTVGKPSANDGRADGGRSISLGYHLAIEIGRYREVSGHLYPVPLAVDAINIETINRLATSTTETL